MKSEQNKEEIGSSFSNPAPPAEQSNSFIAHFWASIASTILLVIICCGAYPLLIWGISQVAFPIQANGSLVKKDGTHTTKDSEAVGSSLLGQNFSLPQYFHPRPSAAGNGYDPTSSGGTNLGPISDKLINGATNAATTQPTTQPESVAYSGVRLFAIHYAVDNNIPFKLYHAVYVQQPDGSYQLQRKEEIPLKLFQDAQGNINDVALIDAFPHPTTDSEYARTVVIADDFARKIPVDAVTASGSGLDPHISPENAYLQAQRVADARNVSVEKVKALIDQKTDGPNLGFIGEPAVNVLLLNLALDAAYPAPAPATAPATAPSTQPGK